MMMMSNSRSRSISKTASMASGWPTRITIVIPATIKTPGNEVEIAWATNSNT